jgi:hypothetical protein
MLIYDFTQKARDINPQGSILVDVREVAQAHLAAFETPSAGNQRYIISASTFDFQQVCLLFAIFYYFMFTYYGYR